MGSFEGERDLLARFVTNNALKTLRGRCRKTESADKSHLPGKRKHRFARLDSVGAKQGAQCLGRGFLALSRSGARLHFNSGLNKAVNQHGIPVHYHFGDFNGLAA